METLGKLQERMLWYLSETPDSLILPIQKALHSHYKNVYDNIFNLKEKGFIQGQGRYRLSIKGIAYVMATTTKDKKAKALRMLDLYAKYENALADLDLMWKLFERLSVGTSVKLLNNIGKSLLIYGGTVWSSDNLQRLVVSTFLNLSAAELKDLKRAIKSIPELRQQVEYSVTQARYRLLEDEGS
jgi:virulence-associated protein VapD